MAQSPFDPGVNPYQSPASAADDRMGDSPRGTERADRVSWRAVDMLRQTRPWVRLISILLFLGGAISLLMGALAGIAVLGGAMRGDHVAAVGAVAVYLVIGIVYIAPAIYLFRYASRIVLLEQFASFSNLEKALSAQKSFWRFVGIASLAVIGLYIVAIAGVALLAVD